jgi:tetratricopeptide (TPR) repeat protein
VGRERELEILGKLLSEVEIGQGRIFFIAGEGGVGKTRLAREFTKIVKAKGVSTLYARSANGSNLLPYSVWVDCLRQFASEASVMSFLEICGEFAESMLKLLPEMSPLTNRQTSRGAEAEQQSVFELTGISPIRYFDAVSQFLFQLSNRGTLCVLLDDFQWCDRGSLDLLKHVASQGLAIHPLLILCFYRDTDLKNANSSLQRTITEISRGQQQNVTLRLQRLNILTATEMLKGWTSALQLTPEFCDALCKKTGGNPLFMRETLALLAQESNQSGEYASKFIASETSEIRVPNSVKDVVRRRLATVDSEMIETLQIAALIGEKFDLEILRRIAPVKNDDQRLLAILRAASASDLLHENKRNDGGRSYCFADEIVVEVLIERFSPDWLRSYHLQIARIKEEYYGERRNDRAAELADHFRRAGSHDKAFEYALAAGNVAARVVACKEARIHYGLALKSYEQLRDQSSNLTRGIILEKLGDMSWIENDWVKAYDEWERAAKTYEQLGDHERAGALRRKKGWYYSLYLSELDKAMEEYKRALRHFAKIPKGPGLAMLHHHVGQHLMLARQPGLAIENYEKAIGIAREFGVIDIDVIASLALAFVTSIDQKEKIMSCILKSNLITSDHILSLVRNISPSYDFAISHTMIHAGGALAGLTGDWVTAQEYFSQGLELARRLGVKRWIIWAGSLASHSVYIPAGEWTKARDSVADALSYPPLNKYSAVQASVLNTLGELSLLEGDLDKAEEYLRAAYDLAVQHDEYFFPVSRLTPRLKLGHLYILKANHDLAGRYLREAHNMLRGPPSKLLNGAREFAECLFLLVWLNVSAGDREEACRHLAQLQDFAGHASTNWASAYSSWATGLVASLDEHWNEAISAFEKAAELWKGLSWPYHLGNTYRSLAMARMEKGEVEVANSLLDMSLEIFNRLHAKRDASEALGAKAAVKEEGSSLVFKLTKEGSDRSKTIFEFLVQVFLNDYITRKLSPDSSGWRSLVEVAKGTKISRSGLYRAAGKNGEGLQELLRLGLAEEREFPHQRGRGGTVTRTRVAYGKEDVKKYIARRSRGKPRPD